MAARERPRGWVHVYVLTLAAAAAAATYALSRTADVPPGRPNVLALPALFALLVAAEYLFVRFRYGGGVNALNLVEAVLAPTLFAFSGPVAVSMVAGAQLVGAVLRRNAPVKSAFNIAQWSLAAAAGSWVVQALAPGRGVSWTSLGALLVALAVVAFVNQTAFTIVLALSSGRSLRATLRSLGPVVVPGWMAGWAINSMVGLLFVLAFSTNPVAVVLFIVPLVMLHLAYRGYAGARSDRVRLAGLHRAAEALAEPLDPIDAVAPFLGEVARCFEARAATLVLHTDAGRLIHTVDVRTGSRHTHRTEPEDVPSLEGALLAHPGPVRVSAAGRDALSRALVDAGWRDCLSAPLMDDGRIRGALVVLDQAGFEGFESGELAVMEALARETAATLAKGRLLSTILDERRKLGEIVSSTSDGIFTVAHDGRVTSWNPAMERITGLSASQIVNVPDGLLAVDWTDPDGASVRLDRWAVSSELPSELDVRSRSGDVHRLSCSFSFATGSDGRPAAMIVVARDTTSKHQIAELREEYERLAVAEQTQRTIVERLQEAVFPSRPIVRGAELGVSYVASGEDAPTGGDLYDWQRLPGGELHVAVVDALGHGVSATRDAIGVVHTLRVLALGGCPLDEIVARTDEVLGAQNPDLVATVLVGRYDPASGRLRLASGGHPPALHLSADGGARQVPAPGGAVGWPGAGSESIPEIVLEPGDAVVLYTDGLVEATRDILEGTETLLDHARELSSRPAEEIASGLVQRALSGADRRDDSLALVIRRPPVVQRKSWDVPAGGDRVPAVRAALGVWLRQRDVDALTVADASLVASELMSNAVTAARARVCLRAEITHDGVTIEVEDDGRGAPALDRAGLEVPPVDADAGRGLFIVRSIARTVDVLGTYEGTVVRARLRSHEPGEETATQLAARRDETADR